MMLFALFLFQACRLTTANSAGVLCADIGPFPDVPTLTAGAKELQMRLAYGNDQRSMLITWSSPNTTRDTDAQVRLCADQKSALVSTHKATSVVGDLCYTIGSNVHTAEVRSLLSGMRYFYSVSNKRGDWSQWIPFRTPAVEATKTYTFAVVGDLGVSFGGPVTRALTNSVNAGELQMVVHNGDIGYADSEIKPSNGTRYQDFLDYHYENTSAFSAQVPYMLLPGNHEAPCNYQEFQRRAVRPAMQRGDYYSFTQGGVHFIMLSAERGQLNGTDAQTVWLQDELELALAMKRNGSIHWLLTFVHYPSKPFGYCTYNLPFCKAEVDAQQQWFEDMFVSHEVDLHFAAHQHVYERTLPVYRRRPLQPSETEDSAHPDMFPNSTRQVFKDPAYPVHVVNGAGGDDVVFPPNWLSPPAWSVANSRTIQFGYTVVAASPSQIDVSYRVPLEQEPGLQRVFPMDEFSILKTAQGQKMKGELLQAEFSKVIEPALFV